MLEQDIPIGIQGGVDLNARMIDFDNRAGDPSTENNLFFG
jgi:hypothetical protein